jgi:hypothetical protein
MRFKLVALSLLTVATTLFSASVLPADTRIFSLERDGQQLGRLALEAKMNPGGAGQIYASQSRLNPSVGRLVLLKHLIEPKQIVLDSAMPQRILRMSQNGTEWSVSTEAPDIRIQRKENGRKVDDLAINPIRPVYDLLSLVANLKADTRQGGFDFYLLEKGHQKRLSVEKAGQRNWQLVYKEKPLADIRFDPQGHVELAFRDSPYFPDISGVQLKERCQLRRKLSVKRNLTVQQIAAQWVSSYRQAGVNLQSGALQGRFDSSKALNLSDGLHLDRDITNDVQKMILGRMQTARAITRSDAGSRFRFTYDPQRRCFHPQIADNAVLRYSYADLEQRFNVEHLGVNANRNNTGLVCTFTERTCNSREMPAYEVPIVKTYGSQIGYDASNPDHAIRVKGDAQNITIEAYTKGLFFNKTIQSVQLAATDFRNKLRVPAGTQLSDVRFDMDAFGKNPENLIILYSAQKCQSQQENRVIEFGPEFEEKFGISARYLRFMPEADGNGWHVKAELQGDFAFCPFRDQAFMHDAFGTAIRPDARRLDIRHDTGRYFFTGRSGLYLTLEEIKGIMDLPSDAVVQTSGGNLEVVYKDFSCNE